LIPRFYEGIRFAGFYKESNAGVKIVVFKESKNRPPCNSIFYFHTQSVNFIEASNKKAIIKIIIFEAQKGFVGSVYSIITVVPFLRNHES
jgi:hypothetical protein